MAWVLQDASFSITEVPEPLGYITNGLVGELDLVDLVGTGIRISNEFGLRWAGDGNGCGVAA